MKGLNGVKTTPPPNAGEPAWGTRKVFNPNPAKLGTTELKRPGAASVSNNGWLTFKLIGFDSFASSTTAVAEDDCHIL